ncbi:MAG: hypothetical protein HGA53_11045 [Anaerolineaceae bacterium]|nr:hypothetical protein [Anaerolineaceae bacterium]
MSEQELNQAIGLFKQGNKEEAGKSLTDLLQREPENESAWLWLAACSTKPEDRRFCLEKSLEINPGNEKARIALAKIAPIAPVVTADVPVAAVDPTPIIVEEKPRSKPKPKPAVVPVEAVYQEPPAVLPVRSKAAKKLSATRKFMIAMLGLLLIVITGIILLLIISGALQTF